jgi:hypothetical protein
MRQGHQDRPGPAAASGRPGHRPGSRFQGPRADPAERLTAGQRTLEERLQGARSNNRFLDKRIAGLEAQLLAAEPGTWHRPAVIPPTA